MSKYSILDIWKMYYGKTESATDYAGRIIKKSACSNPNSSYQPTIDHIRPLSKGGADDLDNIIICHRDTNGEKADSFPHWRCNKQRFKAIKKKGTKGYSILKDE